MMDETWETKLTKVHTGHTIKSTNTSESDRLH